MDIGVHICRSRPRNCAELKESRDPAKSKPAECGMESSKSHKGFHFLTCISLTCMISVKSHSAYNMLRTCVKTEEVANKLSAVQAPSNPQQGAGACGSVAIQLWRGFLPAACQRAHRLPAPRHCNHHHEWIKEFKYRQVTEIGERRWWWGHVRFRFVADSRG